MQSLELWPCPFKHLNSGLILTQTGILILSFETLRFWPYFYIWILALFVQTVEFLSYTSIENIEILALSFQTMQFGPLFIHIVLFIWSFKTLGFWPYFYKRWNSDLMIPKNGILALFFINTGILTLSFQTLEFLYFPSKHWNSGPIFYTLHFGLILRNILLWTID